MIRREFEQLVRAHQVHLYRYLRYLGADGADSEDIVQETFLAALNAPRIGQIDESDRPSYLRGIARNLFRQSRRKARRHWAAINQLELIEKSEEFWARDFLRGGDGFEYVEALRECCQKLPARQKQLLKLQYTDKKSRPEIAQEMGLRVEGVKTLGRRIRAALRECIHTRIRALEKPC